MSELISRQKLMEERNAVAERFETLARALRTGNYYDECCDVDEFITEDDIAVAVEALSQPPADHWVPCIVKLPEKSGEYWVTIIWSNKPTTSTGRYDAEKKTWDRYSYDPIAWKPYTYPEPYKGEQNDRS